MDGTSFENKDFNKINIRGAFLRNGLFKNAKMRYADLRDTDLVSTDLRKVDLRHSYMKGCKFKPEWKMPNESTSLMYSEFFIKDN